MNSNRLKWIISIAGISAALWFGAGALHTNADSPQTGSVNDPLITKSYLDQQLADLVAKEIAKQGGSGAQNPTTPSTDSTSAIKVVQLQTGQTLFAKAGAEFIVRTGKTVAVSTDGDGIPDVTSGKDLAAGSAVELNHLLVFPRDGRGVKPAAKTDAIYVMVRGGYVIQNADGSTMTP